MNPKKANKLYHQVAEDLNINEDLVETITEFYYKEVKNLMTNLLEPRINVEGLGHFTTRPMVINKTIDRISKILETHDTSTFKAYHNKKATEIKLNALLKLKIKIDVEVNRKNEFNKTNKK
jgi:hypothetical protein|tara:strand:- start:1109 stop:1471 length:363 start_codon:yes stop_codon:yes gene_type:complete